MKLPCISSKDIKICNYKEGPKLAQQAVQKFVQFYRSHVNARRDRASFCLCKNLSRLSPYVPHFCSYHILAPSVITEQMNDNIECIWSLQIWFNMKDRTRSISYCIQDPGVNSPKNQVGVCKPPPKTLPPIKIKLCDILYWSPDQKCDTLFKTWPLNQYSVSDLCYN